MNKITHIIGYIGTVIISMQGWKPIESAPKDGSEILLMSRKGRIANGCWMTANNRCGAWLWAYIKQEPTHWMPLPQPPKEQT